MDDKSIYKFYREHQVEIFDIIYGVWQKILEVDPTLTYEEFNKKFDGVLKAEKSEIKEKFKKLGFNIK